MSWLSLLFGSVVGLSLGLTGGGGAIFAVPLLAYGLGVPTREAVAISLVSVGLTSFVGFLGKWRKGEAELRTGLLFAVAGMLGAPVDVALHPMPSLLEFRYKSRGAGEVWMQSVRWDDGEGKANEGSAGLNWQSGGAEAAAGSAARSRSHRAHRQGRERGVCMPRKSVSDCCGVTIQRTSGLSRAIYQQRRSC